MAWPTHIILFLWLVSIAPAITAQDVPSPMEKREQGVDPETEMQAISGELKELLGEVHSRSGAIQKQLSSNTTERNTQRLQLLRSDLDEARTDLEHMLDEVNSADRSEWAAIRSRAEDLIEKVKGTLERVKSSSTSAVN